MDHNYSIIIQWSERDNCFVASLPEWSNRHAQGASYEEALANAQKVLNSSVESSLSEGKSLPEINNFNVSSPIQ